MKNLCGFAQVGTELVVNRIKDGILYIRGKYRETKEYERQQEAENREICDAVLKDYEFLNGEPTSKTRYDNDEIFESNF